MITCKVGRRFPEGTTERAGRLAGSGVARVGVARVGVARVGVARVGVARILPALLVLAAAASFPCLAAPGKPPAVAVPRDFWSIAGAGPGGLDAFVADMGDSELLGQLFMMAYSGAEPDSGILSWISARNLGGVKIYGWNADDTRVLARSVARMQGEALGTGRSIPLFMATDQEGGWIRHVKGGTSVTPGNMSLGASGVPDDAYRSALYIGRELRALGINMNFAPTVDLATRPDNRIIGSRAFSYDPMETAVLAAAFARGLEDAGVMPTAKHFPGHGDTDLDSHGVLPVIGIDEKTLWERELIPYRMLAAESVPGIMSGHLAYPGITGSSEEPASLSERLITGILRGRIGYRGLVITDDLFMSGASVAGGFPEACVRAIRAGNDIIMVSRPLELDDAFWARMLSEMRNDPSFRLRIAESAKRVLETKLKYLASGGRKGVDPAPDAERRLRSAESAAFFLDQVSRGATALGKPLSPLPDSERILLAGPLPDFFAVAERRFPRARSFDFSYLPAENPVPAELERFGSLLGTCDTVVLCVANAAGAAYARAAIAAGKELYIVSILSPVFALDFEKESSIVAVYGYARESFESAFGVLSGDFEAKGRLPVERKKP